MEAGAGYGKTTLALEAGGGLGVAFALVPLEERDADPELLVVRFARALRRAGLSDLAAPLVEARDDPEEAVEALADALAARTDPVVVAVDDAHHAAGDAGELLARLARAVPAAHRLWILARRLPEPAAGDLRGSADAARLDAGDLAFTADETVELCRVVLGADGPAEGLLRGTGGWVAALVLGAMASARGDDASDELRGDARKALGDLVRRALGRLEPEDRTAFLAVARLPLLSPDIADAASGRPGLLERASAAGLPLDRGPGGWWGLPGPVTDLIAGLAPSDPVVARRAATALAAAGEPAAAVDALLDAGEDAAAAQTLAGLPSAALDALDGQELIAAVGALAPAAVEEHPVVLVHLARACEARSRIERRTEALDRAEAIAASRADGVLARQVAAERALDLVRDRDVEAGAAAARDVLAQTGPAEVETRARAAFVLGTALVRLGVPTAEAEGALLEAHELGLAAGRREWAAQALMMAGAGIDMVLGRNARAVARIDEAIALLPPRSGQRAVALTVRAELLNEAGRYDEARASLVEARHLGADLRLPRAVAYAAWEAARTASQTGDRNAVLTFLKEAEDNRGEWFAKETGVIFLADAADLLDRVGDVDAARGYLDRARARRDESPFLVLLAEGAVEARSGDASAAEEILARAAAHPHCSPREAWRIALLRAHAASRRGDPAAASLAERALAQAAELGAPDLPLIRERVVAESLLGGVRAAGGAVPDPAGLVGRIRALGAFAVVRGSAAVPLPPGRPDLIVKLLVARGGRVPAEEAIEVLWPEVEPASGRKRLRNALSRLRADAGELVVRDGEVLALAAGTEVDVAAFDAAARRALAEQEPQRRAGLARAALAYYGGDLLPDERYEEWAAAPRERLRGRHIALIDLLVADADARGDADEAIRLLERAHEADPLDDDRPLRVARLLLAQGRRHAAEAAIARAEATLADLGLPMGAALAALRREVSAGAAATTEPT